MTITGFCWQLWVFIDNNVFSMTIICFQRRLQFLMMVMGLQWQLWLFIGNYGFSLTIMCFQWQLSVLNGDYGSSMVMVIMGFHQE